MVRVTNLHRVAARALGGVWCLKTRQNWKYGVVKAPWVLESTIYVVVNWLIKDGHLCFCFSQVSRLSKNELWDLNLLPPLT